MRKISLFVAAAIICTLASCSDRSSGEKSRRSSAKEETTVVTTTAEEETTKTTTEKVTTTTTAVTTTEAVTTTIRIKRSDAVDEPKNKELVDKIPQEAVERAEKYLTYSANMNYLGVMKSIYPKEIDEKLEANGNYDGVRALFGEPGGEDDPDAVVLEYKLIGAEKLDADIIEESQSFLSSLDKEEPKSPVDHVISDGYLLTLACKDNIAGEEFSRDVGVVLVNDSEWIITMFAEEIEEH